MPAKSGVAGGILLVVPNVMGIVCWSPPLDKMGNSVRGIQFCTVRNVFLTINMNSVSEIMIAAIDEYMNIHQQRLGIVF